MAKLTIKANVKTKFRNEEIQRKIGKAKFEWLSGVGASTRTFAIRSMRPGRKRPLKNATKGEQLYGRRVPYRTGKRAAAGQSYFQKGKYAPAGSPPHIQSPDRKNLTEIYYYIRGKNEVRIGPHWLQGSKNMSRPIPNVHETGGKVSRRYKKRRGNTFGMKSVTNRALSRDRTFNYPKRPFMNPAGVRAIAWLRKKMRGSIK